MIFNQIRYNDTTCYSKIQWEQLQVHVWKAVHPNCKLLAQAVQLNRRNPADHHSLCPDCGLGTRCRCPDPIIAAPYLHFAQLQSKYKWERKTWKKHSFSDGKRFNDFVLLRCFIDFQTTLVDSRNLVIFSTFWYFLHAYLVIALQNIWSHWEDDRIQRKIWNEVMEDLEHQGRFGYVPVATKMPHNPPNKRKWVQWFST
jgi:hypothetical protein